MFTTQRLDHYLNNLSDRFTLRYTLAAMREADGIGRAPGYPTLAAKDQFSSQNMLLGWTRSFDAGQVNQLRIGWSRERVEMPRPSPHLPILQSLDGAWLPGSQRQLDRRENNNVLHLADTFGMRRGRFSLSSGFEFRRNYSNAVRLGLESDLVGGLGYAPHGIFTFTDLRSFARSQPFALLISVDRFSPTLRTPDLNRQFRSNDYGAFVQNDFRIARRVSLNLGLRWEYFGVPHIGDQSQHVNFYFGPGSTIQERLANGALRAVTENPGDLRGRLYRGDWINFAPSAGLSWDVFGRGRTVLRAGYSVALDRIFDSARDLRMNNQQLLNCNMPAGCAPPRAAIPTAEVLSSLAQSLPPAAVAQLDENLRTPYAQNWYAGIQHSITDSTLLEIGHAGSVGRKLISRDLVNRSAPGVLARINPSIQDNTFLSNAGNSNYVALETGIRRRLRRGVQFQVSYTYSHAIDNQSDILEGYRMGPEPTRVSLASFTRQFDARVDRGNANFDQRHNLIFNGIWDLPSPPPGSAWRKWLSGWTASVIGGHRSGFPVTVLASESPRDVVGLWSNRADYVGAAARPPERVDVAGGVQWLDRRAFTPAPGRVGTLGRGALSGPGFWNYDVALLRQFAVAREKVRIQCRIEFYNAFNHANLSVPVAILADPNFGRAFYGYPRQLTRFGELPLDSAARRIQFAVRVSF